MLLNRNSLWFIFLGILLGLSVFVLGNMHSKRAGQESNQEKEIITSVPKIVSCAKSIKVLRGELKNAKNPDGTIAVEVENTNDIGVIAISLESVKKAGEVYSVLRHSFGTDQPIIIINPHATGTLKIEITNINPHAPLRIGSVMFADGSEEGCKSSIESMHESKREHEKIKADENKKGGEK
jgi:hypothetical protein